MTKYKITLTAEERAGLEQLVSVGKAAARKFAHARVLLLADEGPDGRNWTDAQIIDSLHVSVSTIARVRKQFVTEGIGAALDRRSQPSRPEKVKLNEAIEKQLIQLACSDPPQGRCCWTLELLADRLVALGCLKTVSREAVRRALKKMTSSRGLSGLGACPRRQMRTSSGIWRTCSRSTSSRTTPLIPSSVWTKRASN